MYTLTDKCFIHIVAIFELVGLLQRKGQDKHSMLLVMVVMQGMWGISEYWGGQKFWGHDNDFHDFYSSGRFRPEHDIKMKTP